MRNARRDRFVFRPFLWFVLLLLLCGQWIGFFRIIPVIPSPADVNDQQTYYSPLPATVLVYFFRHNAPLLGWHSWMQQDKYTMSFTDTGAFLAPTEDCVNFTAMYLQIEPILLLGSVVHLDVAEVVLCGEPD